MYPPRKARSRPEQRETLRNPGRRHSMNLYMHVHVSQREGLQFHRFRLADASPTGCRAGAYRSAPASGVCRIRSLIVLVQSVSTRSTTHEAVRFNTASCAYCGAGAAVSACSPCRHRGMSGATKTPFHWKCVVDASMRRCNSAHAEDRTLTSTSQFMEDRRDLKK